MAPLEIHTRAENGRIAFDLPASHEALANAHLLVVLTPEPETPAAPLEAERLAKHARLIAAFDELQKVSAFREIADPVQWQRDLRDEWERPLPGHP